MNAATAPKIERIRLKEFVNWFQPNPNYPREMVWDLAIQALGQDRVRTAVPLIEGGARLPLDPLGRIASLYEDGLKRIEKGYDPLLGASNLSRILLKDPEIPKFAVSDKPYPGIMKKMSAIWRPFRKYQGDDARVIYLTLRNWAQTAPESYSLTGARAVDHITAYSIDPYLAADLMRQLVLKLQTAKRYADYHPVEVAAKRHLPKDLREIRA